MARLGPLRHAASPTPNDDNNNNSNNNNDNSNNSSNNNNDDDDDDDDNNNDNNNNNTLTPRGMALGRHPKPRAMPRRAGVRLTPCRRGASLRGRSAARSVAVR